MPVGAQVMGRGTTELREPRSALHGWLPATSATSRDTSTNVVASAVTVEHGGIEIVPQNSVKSGKTMGMVSQTEHSKQKMKIFAQTSLQP